MLIERERELFGVGFLQEVLILYLLGEKIMGDGNRIGTDSSSSSLECDFGLGLKMQVQPTESSTCKRAMVFPHYYQLSSEKNSFTGVGAGGGGGGSGGANFCNTNNQVVGCVSNIYDSIGGGRAVFPRSSQNSAFKGGMLMSGKALFTDTQWQELERQTMIYKYILASIPVPPQLLLQLSNAPVLTQAFQSKTSGLDLRFSSGSDPEPWRCRRTDGKKWRCSRDVAPDQKYCERHAHKSRPRSRKPVETQSQNTTTNNYSQQSLLRPPNATTQNSVDFTNLYDQTRCTEWFMRGVSSSGTVPVSTCNQQWRQLMQSSSKVEYLNRDNTIPNKINVSLVQYDDKQDFMNSFLDHPKLAYLQGNLDLNTEKTQTTRHFIDARSTGEKYGNEGSAASLNKKRFSPSALTLSMSRGIGIGEDNDQNAAMGIGAMNTVKENVGFLNTVSWMSSPPGGPLGEVLGLGNSTTGGGGKGCSDLASPHGYSNSTANSSNCSKSSCEDGSHVDNFIG